MTTLPLKMQQLARTDALEMKPTLPSGIKRNSYASAISWLPTIWSKDRGCPSGTVPVKRITKDDLIRQRDMPPPEPINFKDQVVGGNNNSEPIGRSYTSSYGYKVHDFENIVRFSFFSFDFGIESYFGYVLCNTHCFNTLCPGFVNVNTDLALDMPFDTLSQPGGPSWEVPMYLYRKKRRKEEVGRSCREEERELQY
ncbi:hypothetical protein FXO37_08054 [Capsicum annuum]|nr:hypothetical protein FXO37_08054 [Capsicum annuum]